MIKLDYCIVAPVERHTKAFEKWLDHISKFVPPPQEIIIASENDFPKSDKYTFIKVPIKKKTRHYRIGIAREEIREYVLENTSYREIFSLDSDVFPLCRYIPLTSYLLLEHFNAQLIDHNFQNKEVYPPVSLGCVFMTRELYSLSTFYPHGRFSEDSAFYATILNLGYFGYQFRIVLADLFRIKHKSQIHNPQYTIRVIKIGKEEKG